MKKLKEYDVYFLEDYMQTFKTRKEAEDFIKSCVEFDKQEKNPFGAKKKNYSIEVVENEEEN